MTTSNSTDSGAAQQRFAYAVTVEYDGTAFSGWQRQPGRRTVEGALLLALAETTGEQVRLSAAGRTDAGAHAHGQVVGCTLARRWDCDRLRGALNAHLPEDVVVVEVQPAPPGFHARFDAVARTYRYVVAQRRERQAVARQYAWRVRGPLDLESMRHAAALLQGTHDFAAFGRSPRPGGGTLRTVHDVGIRQVAVAPASPVGGASQPAADDPARGGSVIVIEVCADAFLYGMMRSFAGVLVAVGEGRMTLEDIDALLAAGHRQRARITVAPAHGLHQWTVTYRTPHGGES